MIYIKLRSHNIDRIQLPQLVVVIISNLIILFQCICFYFCITHHHHHHIIFQYFIECASVESPFKEWKGCAALYCTVLYCTAQQTTSQQDLYTTVSFHSPCLVLRVWLYALHITLLYHFLIHRNVLHFTRWLCDTAAFCWATFFHTVMRCSVLSCIKSE